MKNLAVYGLVIIALMLSGCARKAYVDQQIEKQVKPEMKQLWNELGQKQSQIDSIKTELNHSRTEITSTRQEVSDLKNNALKKQRELEIELDTIQDALARAKNAGKLSEGRLLFEVTISDESVFFAYDKHQLSSESKAALDTFAGVLLAENKNVFIEIQGHTDNVGSHQYNIELGEKRAEAVMRYLHTEHNIPLIRMRTFSYGEGRPVVDNSTKENRSKNRRVVLMVME